MSNKKPQKPIFGSIDNISTPPSGTVITHPNDFKHASQFLYSYRGSEATFNAYRRELERLLAWSWTVPKKSIKELKRADIESFIEFCQTPPLEWIGTKNVSRFIEENGLRSPNPEWRPFVVSVSKQESKLGKKAEPKNYVLSQKALQAVFGVLSSFFNYLIQEEYSEYNPVAQIRQKSKFIRKQQNKQVIRRLSDLQWATVIETTEKLANEHPEKYERAFFIMNALYGMYLRISELAANARWQPNMGDFHVDHDGHWWFKTVGKGNKERDITVSDAMLNALKRYRLYLGLSALPHLGESTPLISKSLGRGPVTSTRQIRVIVQDCFDQAIARLIHDGMTEEADSLSAATVHWLRHTGISDDVKHRPREHVRDDAGHGSSAITDKYIDVELRARHASGRKKLIVPE